jgi:hypothetical protein
MPHSCYSESTLSPSEALRDVVHLLICSACRVSQGYFPLSCIWRLFRRLSNAVQYSTCTFLGRVALLFPHYPRSNYPPLPLMSHTHPTSTSSNFQLVLDNALKLYKKRTKNDLLKHPLAHRLQFCNSPASILTVLQEQVQQLNQSQRSNTKWLDPTVNVLLTFSEALGEGVGSVCFKT